MAEVFAVDPGSPDRAVLARAAERLRAGGLVAFPTETVYGLGAHATNRAAVRRVFEAKGRPSSDPLIVHVASADHIGPLVASMPPAAHRLAACFWPGPLTLVLPRAPVVPDEVTAGLDTVAVRVPAHPVARALLEEAGIPIAAPSANLFSRPSPTTAAHVLHDLGDSIDIVIDGGPTTVGVESTVLDLTVDPPRVLRPGAVTVDMLREVIGVVDASRLSASDDTAMRSPGMLSKHYAPRAPLTLYEGDPRAVVRRLSDDARAAMARGQSVGVLAADEDAFESADLRVVRMGPSADTAKVAARLYAALREIDAAGVDVILARAFPRAGGLGAAVEDRLRRAAAGRIVHCGATLA